MLKIYKSQCGRVYEIEKKNFNKKILNLGNGLKRNLYHKNVCLFFI